MQISPKLSIGLNMAYAMLTALSVPAASAMGFAHPEQIAAIAAFAAVPLNVFLHSVSSDQSGPLAPK